MSVRFRKKQVMDMLCKYKDAFSLRDEIGPNVEVEIDVTDKSPYIGSKNILAYPLLKDTFLVLGSCKCEVLSV